MKMIRKYLPLFLVLAQGVRADFVYHDSATTSGGEFNTGFVIGNLKDAGHVSPADVDDAAAINASYATASPPSGGYPVTITLDFKTPVDLTKLYLWNHSNNNASSATNAGVKNFTLSFHSEAGGAGSQIGEVFSGNAKPAPATGTYPAQAFKFAAPYKKVRSVKFVILGRIAGKGFVAVREIGFERAGAKPQTPAPDPAQSQNQTPEPTQSQAQIPAPELAQAQDQTPVPTPEKVLVYLVGGQSNADGYGNPAQLPAELRVPQSDIDFYHGNGGGFSNLPANQWIRLQPGSGSMQGNVGGFGPELNFGIGMRQALGSQNTRIALIKRTRGGSSLHTDWLPGGNATTTGDGPDYQAFQTTVNNALASLKTLYPGATVQLEGMVWHQGEADAGSDAHANAYQTNLTNFIADIRATYGKDLKFGIIQLSNNQTQLKPTHLATVKAAQAAVATANPHNYMVSTDDLPMRGSSKIHLGTPGNLTIGSRLAAGMQQVCSTAHN